MLSWRYENLLFAQPRGGLGLLFTAVAVAAVVWFFLFAVPGTPFWIVIAAATLVLGGAAFVIFPDTLIDSSPHWVRHVVIGALSAAVLYGIFWFGNWVISHVPFGPEQVERVYGTKSQLDNRIIGGLLLFPIGPGEELFWRAWVQRVLMIKLGPWKGFWIALALYAGVHVPSLNPTLILAATLAGGFWALMYMRYGHIGPGLVSHALWDAAIFVWFPIE
ncbi:CPBP family intramembrane metalloprotease [bacterium]|nr:CPBP family intramembrane metalloprotease [bacterium]